MSEKWIVFTNRITNKELSAITVKGAFEHEVVETINLLAYDENINRNDIKVSIEKR